MIITIDGPSGTGKSTVARKVAERLQFVYFDTGAMYRSFTWFVMQKGISLEDRTALKQCLEEFDYKIDEGRYFVNGQEVTELIRSQAVTQFVSEVSAIAEVRTFLLVYQYRAAKAHNVIFEGRDLGTVVFPQAEIKIYLDAEPHIRAERRLKEMGMKGLTQAQVYEDIMRRDAYDSSREIAPLRCPLDAYKVDTSHLSIDQGVNQIVEYCIKQFPNLDT